MCGARVSESVHMVESILADPGETREEVEKGVVDDLIPIKRR